MRILSARSGDCDSLLSYIFTKQVATMIDVGLIGFGLAGRFFHAPIISAVPGLRLASIVQRSGTEFLLKIAIASPCA